MRPLVQLVIGPLNRPRPGRAPSWMARRVHQAARSGRQAPLAIRPQASGLVSTDLRAGCSCRITIVEGCGRPGGAGVQTVDELTRLTPLAAFVPSEVLLLRD